jgi:hypothetical protein
MGAVLSPRRTWSSIAATKDKQVTKPWMAVGETSRMARLARIGISEYCAEQGGGKMRKSKIECA